MRARLGWVLLAGLTAIALWRATSDSPPAVRAAGGDAADADSDSTAAAAVSDSEPISAPTGEGAAIPFSHVLHAGKHAIDCRFCHGQAAHGAEANLPSARDCYVCHWTIAADKPAILELERRVKTGTPITWPASVRLPQHVQFQHAPHVRHGVACAACHGNLQVRENAQPSRALSMGFCVDCHRTEGATHDCMACHQ